MKTKSINPTDNSIIKEYNLYPDKTVNKMIKDCYEDFLLWKDLNTYQWLLF